MNDCFSDEIQLKELIEKVEKCVGEKKKTRLEIQQIMK